MQKNMSNLSVEEIMQRIKAEIEKRKTCCQYSESIILQDTTANSNFEIKHDKKDVVSLPFDNNFEQKEVYEYADFTKYHDIDFITNLYRIILKREPDVDGLNHYLNQLRTGVKAKSEIISILRYSKEGKDKKVKILGSNKRYILAVLYSKPFIGYLTKTFITLFRLPNILKRLNSYENYVNQLHQISIDNDIRLQNLLNNKSDIRIIEDLSAFVAAKAEQKELESMSENLEIKLNSKAEQKELESMSENLEIKLNSKAEQKELESMSENLEIKLNSKAEQKELESMSENLEIKLNSKAEQKELESMSENLEIKLNSKAEQKELESMSENLEIKLNSKAEQKELESMSENLEIKLNSKAEQKELALYLEIVSYAKEYMKISQQNLQNLIDEAKKRLPEEVLNQSELLAISDEEKHIFDTFYVEFEDKFRGAREDIKERLKVYFPYIEQLPFDKKDMNFLDVGCGRGEWLELLKEEGYENTKGLDLNRAMVAKSQELGLDAIESDVIEYLVSLPDNSLSVITGFHIIEHLPFNVLMTLFKESYRVLKKGGLVIFETPNPENIVVGACSFYTDPTHRNPLPKMTMNFIANNVGFIKVHTEAINSPKNLNLENKTLNHFLCTGYDYYVIGYKDIK